MITDRNGMGGVFCMELPKNITQIGEADKHCRVYVEDYVVSYIKQMNGMAQNKDIAIAPPHWSPEDIPV